MEQLAMRRPNLDGLPELPPMPPGYLLRPACEADAEGLAALLATAFANSMWTPEKAHSELLAHPDVKQTYLITCEGRIVATASVLLLPETYPGTGIVHYVAADPEHKGKRLGYLVSLATLWEFARLGCKDALLRTDDPRLPAIKTYLDLGFQPVFIDETHVERWQKVHAALDARTPKDVAMGTVPAHWKALQPEVVAEGFAFPEGAAAAADGSVYLVNCNSDEVSRVAPDGSISVFAHLPGKGNGSRFRPNGTLVVADYAAKCIVEIDKSGNVSVLTDKDAAGQPFAGPNDVIVAKNGDLYFTSPPGSNKDNPIGKVYHYSAQKRVAAIVAEGLAFPNGLALSADEQNLYVAETYHSRIWRFPVFEPGVLGAGRIFTQLPGGHYPDGILFDNEGNLYVAYYGSGNVLVVAPSGELIAELPAGGQNPTNLSFGGPNGDWLYVTESATNTLTVLKVGKKGQILYGQ